MSGAWRKGLTKESDDRVKKQSETIKKKYASGELKIVVTEESRRKQSIAKLGKSRSEEFKKQCSIRQKGIPKKSGFGNKISLALKRDYGSGIRKSWNKGQTKDTTPSLEKMSKSKKEKFASGETIPAMKGKRHSSEARKKISEHHKRNPYILTDEQRKKISKAKKGLPSNRKGCKISDYQKKCMMEGLAKYYAEGNSISNPISKLELKAKDILQKNGYIFTHQKLINGKKFDFYLEDYNLLIEIDGCFFHGKGIKYGDLKYKLQKECRKNDISKNKLAKELGYNLLRIWEDEIDLFKIKLSRKIKKILKSSSSKK